MEGFKVIKYFVCVPTGTVYGNWLYNTAAAAATTKGFSCTRNCNCALIYSEK